MCPLCSDINFKGGVYYKGKHIPAETILKGCSTLVYVIDAQDGAFGDTLPKLVDTIVAAHKVNPSIHFEVFLHKGDVLSMYCSDVFYEPTTSVDTDYHINRTPHCCAYSMSRIFLRVW